MAARAVRGQTVVEKMPCQRMRDRQGKATREQIWDTWGYSDSCQLARSEAISATERPETRSSNQGQGQWTMGHSYAFGVKVRGGK